MCVHWWRRGCGIQVKRDCVKCARSSDPPKYESIYSSSIPRLVSKLGTSSSGLLEYSIPTSIQTPLCSSYSGFDVIVLHTLGGTALYHWHRVRPEWQRPRAPVNPSDLALSGAQTWLRDMLAPDLAPLGARVMAYGYSTDPGSGGVKTTPLGYGREMHILDIECLAKDLLCNVAAARRRPVGRLGEDQKYQKKRPLVFIAHGFGGLVLKKAVLLCLVAPQDSEWVEIGEAIAHIVFLSTPHEGSDKRLPARWSDVVFASGLDVAILSHEWIIVTKDFQALGKRQDINFTVVNVVEARPVLSAFGPAKLKITTPDVAYLGWADIREKMFVAKYKNHLTIPDISGRGDPVYKYIKNSILERLSI